MSRSAFCSRCCSLACCALCLVVCGGCASIISGETQPVRFTSYPEGAVITVKNRDGEVIQRGKAPFTTTVYRGAGYFKGNTLTVTASMAGHSSETKEVPTSLNGWYVGNILFGGIIGMVIVDPATGAMHRLPEEVHMAFGEASSQPTIAMASEEAAGKDADEVFSIDDLPKWQGRQFEELRGILENQSGAQLIQQNGNAQYASLTYVQNGRYFTINVANGRITSITK